MTSSHHGSMSKVFIDSSVLIAALISPTGNARALLLGGLRGSGPYTVACNAFVLDETERNVRRKAPAAVEYFQDIRAIFGAEFGQPPAALVERCAELVHIKDAVVVAGAVHAGAIWLASYDRKHLLTQRDVIAEAFGVTITTPDEILSALAAEADNSDL
jgi:predicted nucleic acid-binding protein